jgi:hypothetical protein
MIDLSPEANLKPSISVSDEGGEPRGVPHADATQTRPAPQHKRKLSHTLNGNCADFRNLIMTPVARRHLKNFFSFQSKDQF